MYFYKHLSDVHDHIMHSTKQPVHEITSFILAVNPISFFFPPESSEFLWKLPMIYLISCVTEQAVICVSGVRC